MADIDKISFSVEVSVDDAIEKLERIKELLTEINQLKEDIFGKQPD